MPKPPHVSDEEYAQFVATCDTNARLIAAAPELLEALIAVRQRGLPDRYTSDVELADQVDAAIAKAKGGAA